MKFCFISKVWFTIQNGNKHVHWGLFKVRKFQYDVIVIEEYLIATCDFIGRRLFSPTSYIFMKTRFCQSNCPQYVWSITEKSTVVDDNDIPYVKQHPAM